MGGIGVDFEQTKAQAGDVKEAEAESQFGGNVSITFKLPDGTEATHPFKMGHTVEYVKAFLAKEHDIPMNKQTLKFQDEVMIDPLSLVDIRGFEEGVQFIAVEAAT